MAAQADTAVIIVAAERGTRVGDGLPMQWRDLGGMPVVARSVAAFQGFARIVVVLHPDDLSRGIDAFGGRVVLVAGGRNRFDSVRNALATLEGSAIGHALIHDGARPLVSDRVIDAVLAALSGAAGAAPALPVTDALWRGAGGRVATAARREGLFRAQTPQGFALPAILAAYRAHPGPAADDVAVALAAGLDVAITEGEEENIEVASPADFDRAERLLRHGEGSGRMDVRTGNGYDVHAFRDGDHVMLCGVRVAHDKGLLGHSDADVGMHALTDAIYGAMAEGDIGRHFPPSDPQWKDADSAIFLAHAGQLAATRGYRLSNADVTLVCERPKIGPLATAMAAELARILGVAADRISVKATTSERLGFTGREEGIAALATVTLVAP